MIAIGQNLVCTNRGAFIIIAFSKKNQLVNVVDYFSYVLRSTCVYGTSQ